MRDNSGIPQHVAIIMDGNGRWATRRGIPKMMGHRAGVKAGEEAIEAARELGVKVLTLYTFSTENWKRPKAEVSALFRLLEAYLDKNTPKLMKNNIRFSVIGRIAQLPASTRERIDKTIELTSANTGLVLNLALNYGGRPEITDAAAALARDVEAGKVNADAVDEALFASYLYTKGLPDPDLLIRTSGEFRISNFLLWQIAYAELYIVEKLWPDFKKADFKKAIAEYQERERRFGG
jgi:undecaprenyl diphosphate synthase